MRARASARNRYGATRVRIGERVKGDREREERGRERETEVNRETGIRGREEKEKRRRRYRWRDRCPDARALAPMIFSESRILANEKSTM